MNSFFFEALAQALSASVNEVADLFLSHVENLCGFEVIVPLEAQGQRQLSFLVEPIQAIDDGLSV